MLSLAVVVAVTIAVWFAVRWFGRGTPYPAALAVLFDNRLAERFSGTEMLIRQAGVRSGMRVLDAGCGPGRLTIPLARHVGPGGQVVALDVQEGMLRRVAINVSRAGLTNVRTILGALESNARTLLAEEGAFDRIFLVTVLGEIPDRAGALRSLFYALKPGGVLSIFEMILDPDFLPRSRVRQLALDAGFEPVATYGWPLVFTATYRRPA